MNALKPSKTSKKEEIMILAGDARSKLGYKKTASSEPIIRELLQDLRSAGKNPTPLCADSVLQSVCLLWLYLYQCLFRDLLYNQRDAVDDTNVKTRRISVKANLCLQLCQLPTTLIQLLSQPTRQPSARLDQEISLLTYSFLYRNAV